MNCVFFGTFRDWKAFCNISEGEEIEHRWEKGLVGKDIECDWIPYPNCYFKSYIEGRRYSKIFIPRCMTARDLLFILSRMFPDYEVVFYTKDELYKES